MKTNMYEELSKDEAQSIDGGSGFWYTVGKTAHELYNEVASWFE